MKPNIERRETASKRQRRAALTREEWRRYVRDPLAFERPLSEAEEAWRRECQASALDLVHGFDVPPAMLGAALDYARAAWREAQPSVEAMG